MKSIRVGMVAAAACLLFASGAATAQQNPPREFDVLANPDFMAATESFSAAQSLELAAHISMALRQHERAIPMYEALLKDSPKRADLWAMLAAAYNRINEPREALDAADIAVTLAPHYPHFYVERGIAAFRLDMHERSIDDLKHFVKAFPVNARGHYYLGLAQAAIGDVDAARANLLRARRLNPALTLLTDYYLGLIAANRGQMGLSLELLARTQQAFEGSQLPISALVTGQLESVEGVVSSRLRAAMHEADVRIAHAPGSPAGR